MSPEASLERPGGRWWLSLLLAFLSWGVLWRVWVDPDQLPSEDAWRLARGLIRYSVLEQSPHFPGYPLLEMVGQGVRVLTGWSSAQVLHVLNALSLSGMLWLAFAFLSGARQAWTRDTHAECGGVRAKGWMVILPWLGGVAWVAFNPLVLGAAHSGLSDLPGLALALAAAWLGYRGRWLVAAGLWGAGASVRPGLAVLWLGLAICGLVRIRDVRTRLRAGLTACLPLAIGAGWMLMHDGPALMDEALRFVKGHFMGWGSPFAQVSHLNWAESLAQYGVTGGLIAVACLLPLVGWQHRGALWWLWLVMAGWTLLAQHPEHLRHLLPVWALSFAWAGWAASAFTRRVSLAVNTALALMGMWMVVRSPLPAPLDAVQRVQAQLSGPRALLSRHAPELLSERLPDWRVLDPVNAGDAALWQRADAVWWLTSTSPQPQAQKKRTFEARFPTEETLYLYQPPR